MEIITQADVKMKKLVCVFFCFSGFRVMNVYRSKPFPHPLDKKPTNMSPYPKKKKPSRSTREHNTRTTRVSTHFFRPVNGLVVFFFLIRVGGYVCSLSSALSSSNYRPCLLRYRVSLGESSFPKPPSNSPELLPFVTPAVPFPFLQSNTSTQLPPVVQVPLPVPFGALS